MTVSELIEQLKSLPASNFDMDVEVRNAAGDFAPIEEVTEHEDRWGVVIRVDS